MFTLATAACATTTSPSPQSAPSARAGANSLANAAPSVASSEAADAVATALECMLSASADAARCQHLAALAAVPPDALAHATPFAVEQLTEYVRTRARAERISPANRADLTRWLDLAAGAAQEALTARNGAQCQNVEACASRAGGHPEIGELEEAARWDTRAAGARAQLMSLFRFAPDAGELSADVEASAWIILAHRIETAERARPEVRTETLRAVNDTVRDLGGDVPDAPHATSSDPGSARAHDVNPVDALAPARSLLRDRLGAALPRVTQSRVRETAQAALGAPSH